MNLHKTISAFASSASLVVASLVLSAAAVSAQGKGWQIPAGAADEHSPLTATPAVLKKGESLYKSACAKCHGPKGLGDGPDVDRADRANKPANLTLSRNPEGVMFYKIWNGRDEPRMPTFKSQMTRNEVWAVVEYAKSLRTGPTAP